MNFKDLEKATHLYNVLANMKKEISEIQSLATLAANKDIKSFFELKIDDLDKKKEDQEKVHIDEEGNLVRGGVVRGTERFIEQIRDGIVFFGNKTIKKENEHIVSYPLSVKTTLSILEVLLNEKKEKIKVCMEQLNTLGFV